jgi:hypothetical protein
MADVRQQKKEGPALFNWMWYALKHIIVRSENLVRSIKAANRSLFNGDRSTQVIFDISAMSRGYYLDSAAIWLSFNVTLQSIGVTMSTSFDLIWTEGFNPLSIGFSCTIAIGHLVEDIKNYDSYLEHHSNRHLCATT